MIITPDGYEVLRTMSARLSDAVPIMAEVSKRCLYDCEEYGTELGPHRATLQDVVFSLSEELSKMTDEIGNMCTKLRALADSYEDICLLNPFATIEAKGSRNGATERLVSQGYSVQADVGKLDPRLVNDICERVAATKTQFPELEMQFVGSLQARNMKAEKQYRDMLMGMRATYEAYHPDSDADEIDAMIESDVRSLMDDLAADDNTIAQSIYPVKTDDPAFDTVVNSIAGISVNEKYGSAYDVIEQTRRRDVDSGYKPENCYSPKATIDHELGHQIDKLVGARDDTQIKKWYRDFSRAGEMKQIEILSGYAATSIAEFIAEAWSEYNNNPNCREMARQVAERIKELYSQRYGSAVAGG